MNKQEEIREWAKKFLQGVAHNGYYEDLEVRMLEELGELGVVIKVDGELPDTSTFIASLLESVLSHEERVEALKKHSRALELEEAGYAKTKPLIGE